MHTPNFAFDQPALLAPLHDRAAGELDDLPFGVIGFDHQGLVQRYNRHEAQQTGLHPERVIGRPLFTDIAQCMNNYLVAQRFEDAAAGGQPLDDTLDYVLTWRMKPTPVRLRLLAGPGQALRYLLIERRAS